MVLNTRRRALGLLLAAAAVMRLPTLPRALAQAKRKECLESKSFGPWRAQASNAQAGARINEVNLVEPCDLQVQVQVSESYESKLVVYGDPDDAPLPRDFLVKPENRLIVRTADGKAAVEEPLCGNCTDIFDDKVSIVLPLATAPLFREEKSIEIAIALDGKDPCRFKLDCETLRKGLAWASERKEALAKLADEDKCTPPEGCFITTACCEALGLREDCFELEALRAYRDQVLAKRPGGDAAIALYYEFAPLILARLPLETREARLIDIYARYILPASLAARLGLDALAYRLYARMLEGLIRDFAADRAGHLRLNLRA
ncbi:MAG TPA: CFI-box-CTERM domain-containing protein [Methyloceanibacter sp.]|nr:CFI-box-CTERM domain-containing protein [Methyloceanibacter sp.]